jgi:trehalose synthase
MEMPMLHINSTRRGGGVAELLSSLIPLFCDLGLTAEWRTLEGPPEFFKVTKAFHKARQGLPAFIRPAMFDLYQHVNAENAKLLDLRADVVIIHDYQPLALVEHRVQKEAWIWRCHIDLSRSIPKVWLSRPERSTSEMLSPYVAKYDEAIFSMTEFAQNLPIRKHVIPGPRRCLHTSATARPGSGRGV